MLLPLGSVGVVRDRAVSVCCAVTWAPKITAPLGSVTVPRKFPVICCAEELRQASTTNASTLRMMFMWFSSLPKDLARQRSGGERQQAGARSHSGEESALLDAWMNSNS